MTEDDLELLDGIRASYLDHPGYRHWFWDWFSQAELDQSVMQEFALLYYEHVVRFRRYIAGALSVVPSETLQEALAEILADEYGIQLAGRDAAEGHPEMFRGFMKSLGLAESDWSEGSPTPGIAYFFDAHFAMIRGVLISESIGAVVFGMESTTPYRHGKVLDGITRFQKATGIAVDHTFFSQHISVDEHHSSLLIAAALPFCRADPGGVARGARYSFDAREVFLDDLALRLGARRDSEI